MALPIDAAVRDWEGQGDGIGWGQWEGAGRGDAMGEGFAVWVIILVISR